MNRVCILVLNYNNYKDTIICIKSILNLSYKNYCIIVVDNGSTDNSIEYLKSWLEGNYDVNCNNKIIKNLTLSYYNKKLKYLLYNEEDILNLKNIDSKSSLKHDLVIIKIRKNKGFAGGNNVGIKYFLESNICDYIWLLSNDTVVSRESLFNLIKKTEYYRNRNIKVGMIGSKLLYYDAPKIINGIGGKYNKYWAFSKHIGIYEEDNGQYDCEYWTKQIDYVMGAAMFVSKEFIENVGLMCEDYFLYFEELDWALRGKKKGWEIGYCWDSIVYHKEGGTIGSSFNIKKVSEVAEYWGMRNKIIFTKKFYPHYLFLIYISFFRVILSKIKRGDFKRLKLVIKSLLGIDINADK